METKKGYIDHFIYRNEANGFGIFILETEDGALTVKGNCPGVSEGETVIVDGDMVEDPVYGEQFKMTGCTVAAPEDEESIRRYLGSGAIKGVGPVTAANIVKKFKKDTIRIIEEEPEKLAEIKGITKEKALKIAAQVTEKRDQREAMLFLSRYGIRQTLAAKIYNEYGAAVYHIIEENPYRLADDIRGVGFKTADEIASKVGIAVDSDFRIRSGILYTLSEAAGQGNTYLPKDRVVNETSRLLSSGNRQIDPDDIEPHIRNLAMEKKIIVKNDDVYLKSFYHIEEMSAGLLLSLSDLFAVSDEELLRDISWVEEAEQLTLDPIQRDAVKIAATNGVMVLAGGPGTGKTTTIRAIIRYFENQGLNLELAAPTGRAAKRMAEATGRGARTIHRLLEVNGGDSADVPDERVSYFAKNEDNPLEMDVVIIDEVSMVDAALFYALLKAIPEGVRLILVGDMNQLPSVGAGNVLRDIIDSQCVPVVTLEKIFRQAETSDIIVNAHKIHRGEPIEIQNNSKDFFFQRQYQAEHIIRDMLRLVRERIPNHLKIAPTDVQVLTPMRSGNLGVEGINPLLQNELNPPSPEKNEYVFGDRTFRENDKVMQIKNNYQIEWETRGRHGIVTDRGTGVFNGDMGIIRSIDTTFEKAMEVEYEDGHIVTYPLNALEDLEHAYAVTVHKSQGSEYPAVVLPLLSGPRLLLNRNILYTAVTRAKRMVVIVGNDKTFQDMIQNDSQAERFSGLCERLCERI